MHLVNSLYFIFEICFYLCNMAKILRLDTPVMSTVYLSIETFIEMSLVGMHINSYLEMNGFTGGFFLLLVDVATDPIVKIKI